MIIINWMKKSPLQIVVAGSGARQVCGGGRLEPRALLKEPHTSARKSNQKCATCILPCDWPRLWMLEVLHPQQSLKSPLVLLREYKAQTAVMRPKLRVHNWVFEGP